MQISLDCASTLIEVAEYVWSLAKTREAQILLWLIAGTKVLSRYLRKIAIAEARKLTDVLSVALLCAIVVIVTEAQVITHVKTRLQQCTAPETQVTMAKRHIRNDVPAGGNK